MTWREIDNVVLSGALQGIGGVAGGLASAGVERAKAAAMYGATGAIVGFNTEWQRTLAMNSKHRPSTKGNSVTMSMGGGRIPTPPTVTFPPGPRSSLDVHRAVSAMTPDYMADIDMTDEDRIKLAMYSLVEVRAYSCHHERYVTFTGNVSELDGSDGISIDDEHFEWSDIETLTVLDGDLGSSPPSRPYGGTVQDTWTMYQGDLARDYPIVQQ